MGTMQVNNGTAAMASSRQCQQAQADRTKEDPSQTLWEMMKDAREQAGANRDRFKNAGRNPSRYSDLPIMAHARLARAKNSAQVNAAAGYARRQIAYLRGAKRTDPDNAKRIQAAINQLQKAVARAGKKNRELEREKLSEAKQKKQIKEKRLREAQRQRQELRRKQTMRMIRESGYVQEAETDKRVQSQIAAVDVQLREQVQNLTSSIRPSSEAVARQYAAAPAGETPPDTALNLQA